MQRAIFAVFILMLISVHGFAPGSDRFCLMKTSLFCNHEVPATTEISAPDCCSDSCMTGTKINLPSTELCVQAAQTLKSLNPGLLVEIIYFNSMVAVAWDQRQIVRQIGTVAPSLSTQLAKLQVFLI